VAGSIRSFDHDHADQRLLISTQRKAATPAAKDTSTIGPGPLRVL
jgi:hypothetical protein